MSAVSDYAARVNAAFDKIGASVDGVVDDANFLKETILEIQNRPDQPGRPGLAGCSRGSRQYAG